MLATLLAVLAVVLPVDAMTGTPLHAVPVAVSATARGTSVFIDGERAGYTDFHGVFAHGRLPATIRLHRLSRDERRTLAHLNAFRARLGLAPLEADENLTETAIFWSHEERISGRIGHTCAALGHPAACVEFNDYYHRLPGVTPDMLAGQNAAFDTLSSWLGPEEGFEAERFGHGERGHYLNLIDATQWIGFGETIVPGYGSYFAMNLM